MSSPKISQREAQAMRKQLRQIAEREQQARRAWSQDWPGGVCLASLQSDPVLYAKIQTARRLDRPVVVTCSNGDLYFHAVLGEVTR